RRGAARARIGGGACRRVRRQRARRAARRSVHSSDQWPPHCAAASSDSARGDGLELRAALGNRADHSAARCRLPGRFHHRGSGWSRHRRPHHRRRCLRRVANLAAKSLISTDISSDVTYHRLLDTTRAYALEKLAESGEGESVRRCHAEHYRDLFQKAEAEAATRPAGDWRGEYTRQVGNLRAALNWAFSDIGDVRLGVGLAAVATDFWLTVSLLSECC